ncbi:hypothetical protein Trydic_g6568 [Trypoxylus dichotomus]
MLALRINDRVETVLAINNACSELKRYYKTQRLFRKYESGFDKQKKKVKRHKFLESQTGALVKFLKPIGEKVDDHDVTQTHDDVSNEITPSTSSIHGQKTNSDINESLVDQTTVGSISVDATPAPVKTISRTTESCNPLNSTAQHNIAFRGSNSKLYEPNNGNFLGLIEMISTFDPVMQEHLRRIRSSEIYDHYLEANIQNELIKLLSEKLKEEIVSDIKPAKYFSALLDRTPDLSHQEQVIRFVNIENNISATKNKSGGVTVEEHFLEFLDVKSTTGKNLTDVLLEELDKIGLEIKDCRGQGYDNGSDMEGSYSGVQARILKINPRAFYMPCASHSLNLLICDAGKCSPKAITFFGIVQRIYVAFSASTKRWNILKKHVPDLTVKKSCDTRWESKIESVKALRYQIKEVHDAFDEVVEATEDPKAKSEARSLINEIRSYEFLVALAIWYDVLFGVNSNCRRLLYEEQEEITRRNKDAAAPKLNEKGWTAVPPSGIRRTTRSIAVMDFELLALMRRCCSATWRVSWNRNDKRLIDGPRR